MKVLRFRAITPAIKVRCGSDIHYEASGIYPVHFVWDADGGSKAKINLTNYSPRPIKLKITQEDNQEVKTLFEDDYIGDSGFTDDLLAYNEANYVQPENIIDTDFTSYYFETDINTVVNIKVYCPFDDSGFNLLIECL